MSVLGIDTSSRARTVCVVAGERGELLHSDVRSGLPVGQALPLALANVGVGDVRAIVAVLGPGSYTGLRAGLAAALAIAQVRRLPLHGVTALDVVAAGWDAGGSERGTAAVDAGRGGCYVAACVRTGSGWEAGAPRRVPLAGLDASGAIASTDDLPLVGLIHIDPAQALARVVPLALQQPPLPLNGLSALYVE